MKTMVELARKVMQDRNTAGRPPTQPREDQEDFGRLGRPGVDLHPSLTVADPSDTNDRNQDEQYVTSTTKPRRFSAQAEDIDKFALSGQIILIYLEALGEAILMVADNAPPERGHFGHEYIVYEASEWRALIGVTVEHFRFLHRIKRLFGGRIASESEPLSHSGMSSSEPNLFM